MIGLVLLVKSALIIKGGQQNRRFFFGAKPLVALPLDAKVCV